MEYSSPLAAIRPQAYPSWGNRKDVPISRSMYHGYQTYGPNSFDFKNMSMQPKPAKNDYFSLKPVRGSSPTSTLMADLDANFHIDQSPQVQTPRRSLFTADLFQPRDDAGRLMTPPIELAEGMATTPDVPSSSPGIDGMDISPLPHKLPHFVAQLTLPSPTPEATPESGDEIVPALSSASLQESLQALADQPPTFIQLPERRRAATRPSLSRIKALSTTQIPQLAYTSDVPLPAFRFGNVATNGLSCASTPSLLESFTESPVDDTRPSSAQQMPPPRSRGPSLCGMSRNTGSPSSGHVRKPSAGRQPFPRPVRKAMRRSLSMFQHPDDVMKEEQDTFEPQPSLASVMDIDQEPSPERRRKLPSFIPEDSQDGLPRITQDTMTDILDSKYNNEYQRILIVDCRFEYEYNGGHITSAVNFNDKQQLTNELFAANEPSSTLLILHCEYSVHRAPLTAKFIRSHDRSVNEHQYPALSYPEMYILDGGYSKFFSQQPAKCYPQNYVEMNDHRHEQACERGMAKVKQQRQKLFRAQTFAFGQSMHEEMDDSPTAAGRTLGPRSSSTFDIGHNIVAGMGQPFARRLASY